MTDLFARLLELLSGPRQGTSAASVPPRYSDDAIAAYQRETLAEQHERQKQSKRRLRQSLGPIPDWGPFNLEDYTIHPRVRSNMKFFEGVTPREKDL